MFSISTDPDIAQITAAQADFNRTSCQLCLLHVILDNDPDMLTYRLIKLHQAIRAYMFFLQEEGMLNVSKAIVGQVFMGGLAISFALTYVTVNWYAQKFTKKKEKEEKPQVTETEQRKKNLENLMASSEDEAKDEFD